MSAVTATVTRLVGLHRPYRYRRQVHRLLDSPTAYVPPAKYIPHSTADLWRSARRRYTR
jgi:hypothetical protein